MIGLPQGPYVGHSGSHSSRNRRLHHSDLGKMAECSIPAIHQDVQEKLAAVSSLLLPGLVPQQARESKQVSNIAIIYSNHP